MPSWAADLVAAIQLPHQAQTLRIGEQYAAVVPAGATVQTLNPGSDDERERAGLAPVRPRGTAHFAEAKSFAQYISKHKATNTEIYVDIDSHKAEAILDWHGDTGPGWGVHRAVLHFWMDKAWREWKDKNRQTMSQTQFAEFLEDNRDDIVSPAAASVMEACSNLHVTTSASFSSKVNLADGTTAFSYTEEQKSGQVKVPQEITLQLSPFQGVQPYAVTARIRTAIKDQKLTFKFIMDRPHLIIENAVKAEIAKIEVQTGLTVFYGVAPQPLINL